MDTWASIYLESRTSKIETPPFITDPVSKNLFWIIPSKGASSSVCSSLILYKSYWDLATNSSELA